MSPVAQPQQQIPIEQVLERLSDQDTDGLLEAARLLLDAAMLFEPQPFFNAAPYERTAERRD